MCVGPRPLRSRRAAHYRDSGRLGERPGVLDAAARALSRLLAERALERLRELGGHVAAADGIGRLVLKVRPQHAHPLAIGEWRAALQTLEHDAAERVDVCGRC